MKQATRRVRSVVDKIKNNPKSFHIFAFLVFAGFVFYYMTPSVLSCGDTVFGFGDNTAGPIWRHTVSSASPLWGHEGVTNFPIGESLFSPVNFVGVLQYVWYWMLALLAGPICGYNLVNMIGFLSSAMLMYGFVYKLFKNKWIALLAGYAVTFSPYFQVKVGGHPSYGYQAILVGLIWAFVNILEKKRRKDSVIFGFILAACFYYDPYFSLMALTIVGPLILTWLLFNRKLLIKGLKQKIIPEQVKLLGISACVVVLGLLPLVGLKLAYGSQINNYVSSSRGNILYEARACSNMPHEYLNPFLLNPVLNKILGPDYKDSVSNFANHFTCGIGEDSVGLSIALFTVTSLGLVILSWEAINRRRLNYSTLSIKTHKILLWGVVGSCLTAILLALPPLKFHHIPSPAYVLLSITTTWRTLSRLYVVVNIALVILSAFVLAYFSIAWKKHTKLLAIAFAIISLGVFTEYQAFKPFEGNRLGVFSYKTDSPPVYRWLEDQQDINAIAEYPLEKSGSESDASSYYLTMQTIHKKKLFNSALPNSPQEKIRNSLKDLSNPQTIQALRALGIDTVVVHGATIESIQKIPYLEIVYSQSPSEFNVSPFTPIVKKDTVVVARISNETPKAASMIVLDNGFFRNLNIIRSSTDWAYESVQDSMLVINHFGNDSNTVVPVCFNVRMSLPADRDDLVPVIDGSISSSTFSVTGRYSEVRILAKNTVKLHSKLGHNMQISQLGCK